MLRGMARGGERIPLAGLPVTASRRRRKERCGRRERRLALNSKNRRREHPSCKQLPGAAATLTSPICSSTCSSGSTVGPWLRLGPRQPKLTGMLRDDEEAPEDGDEGGGGGGGEEARNSSESAMGLSWYRRTGPSNRTHTNCLSTARAQSPQAPPPPTRSPAPSSRLSLPWTISTFHFFPDSQSDIKPGVTRLLRTPPVRIRRHWSRTLQLPECRANPCCASSAPACTRELVGLFRTLGSWMRMTGRWSLLPFPRLYMTRKPYWPSCPLWRRRKAEEGRVRREARAVGGV